MEEKPSINLLVNRGIYVLNPEVLAHVPKDQEFPITMLFETLLAGRATGGRVLLRRFLDRCWAARGSASSQRKLC